MKTFPIPGLSSVIRYHDLPGIEPAIVMIHGLGSSASMDFVEIAHHPLFRDRRFILADLPGFGFSDRPEGFDCSLESHAGVLYRLLESLGLSGCLVFGHSMGGTIAIVLCAAHPGIARCLCLAEANLDPGVGQVSAVIAGQPEDGYVSSGHGELMAGLRAQAMRDPGMCAWLGASSLADPRAMHRSAVGLLRGTSPSPRKLFLSMSIPRAFIFGERSLPDPDVERLAGAGIKVLVVKDAGHGMMHDNPEGFAEALRDSFGE